MNHVSKSRDKSIKYSIFGCEYSHRDLDSLEKFIVKLKNITCKFIFYYYFNKNINRFILKKKNYNTIIYFKKC